MRAALPLVVVVVVVVGGLAGCGDGASFCERAADFQAADPEGDLATEVDEALETLDDLVDDAPPEIAPDLATVREGLEAVARGASSPGARFAVASEKVRVALEEECGT